MTMFKTKKLIILSSLFALVATTSFAKAYTLPYENENRWVAKQDAAELRELVRTAKSEGINHFYVQLPESDRTVSLERLMVLRDILERQVKGRIIIEEVDENKEANKILVHTSRP